jgi:ABC-2 type transport system permease protein
VSAAPAPVLRSVSALAALELRLLARRGENVLVALVVPVAVLLFFGGTSLGATLGGLSLADARRTLVPGTIALAIIAAGLVNLGIATAYERSYGVLKRLGGAPIPRWVVLAAKVAALVILVVAQVAVLIAIAAAAFSWAPGSAWSPILASVAILLGTVTFAALGLLLAGTLRAEATLALANGLFLGFLMLGGLVVPIEQLPTFLQPVAAALPASALADLLRTALDSGVPSSSDPGGPLAVLLAWGAGGAAVASRTFRWE